MKNRKKKIKEVCIICEVELKDGKWVGKHISPCANDRYGTYFTKKVEEGE